MSGLEAGEFGGTERFVVQARLGAGGYGVEEVATGAGGVVARVQIELFERGQSCGQRRAGGLGVILHILHGWWRLYFVWLQRLQYFCGGERECAVWVSCAYSKETCMLLPRFFMRREER